MIRMKVGPQIGGGKTKIVYADPSNPDLAILYFTDTITAGDGIKRDVIAGKSAIDWRTNKNIFERCLVANKIPTHYISSPEVGYTVVKNMTRRVPLEVVGRRIATGSYGDRHPEVKEGTYFPQLIVEFFYKDDFLHDPKLDDLHIAVMRKKTDLYDVAKQHLINTFIALENAFAKQQHQLVDIKIEVGYVGEPQELVVVDEISAGSFRLWPFADGVKVLDTTQPNVLSQLNKGGMKDKQIYREGGGLEKVKKGFELIAEMTDNF